MKTYLSRWFCLGVLILALAPGESSAASKTKKKAAGKKVNLTFTEHTDVLVTIKGKKEMDMFKKGEGISGEIDSETPKTYFVKDQRGFLYEVPKKSVTVKKKASNAI